MLFAASTLFAFFREALRTAARLRAASGSGLPRKIFSSALGKDDRNEFVAAFHHYTTDGDGLAVCSATSNLA